MIATDVLNLQNIAIISSLSSNERWQAARWFDRVTSNNDLFISICVFLLFALTILFVMLRILDVVKQRRKANRLFHNYADKRGLNIREKRILLSIAAKARLRLSESIFSMPDIFDRGATKMIRAALAANGSQKSKYISSELSILRQKLGFSKRNSVSALALRPGKADSRQIPIGRKLHLTSLDTNDIFEAEALIIDNNELELCIRLTEILGCVAGDTLCVRYYSSHPVWEFDSAILRIQDDILFLTHSENIRYINRRRFLRVEVQESAYIAAFPFSRDLVEDENSCDENYFENEDLKNIELPKFVPADVTELAGPGLKIIAPVEVKVGDRVAVILKLKRENNLHSYQSAKSNTNTRIIEDIGIVRHTQAVENGLSIAVELNNLNESSISEMVKVTNQANINKNRIKEIKPVKKEKSEKWEYITETIVN